MFRCGKHTEKFGHWVGRVCTAADPVFDSVVVEADDFLVVDVWERIVGAQLLDIFTISRSFVVSSHNTIEGPVTLFVARKSHSYNHISSVVAL